MKKQKTQKNIKQLKKQNEKQKDLNGKCKITKKIEKHEKRNAKKQ